MSRNSIELRITPFGGNTLNVTDFANWQNAVFVFEEAEDELSYKLEIQDVILIGEAADLFINPQSLRYDCEVVIRTYDPSVPDLTFSGQIILDDVEFFEIHAKMCKISIRLDGLDRLLAQAESRLTTYQDTTIVLIEPKRDAAMVGFLGLFASLVYMIVKTAADIIQNRAIYAAIFGAGVGGPVSSQIFLVVSLAMQILVLAILVAALIRVVRDIVDFLRRTRTESYAYRIGDCVRNIAAAAGYSVPSYPARLDKIYIVTPPSPGMLDYGKWQITGKEVLDVARVSLNNRVIIVNNTLRFVPVRPYPTLPPTHPYKRARVENYKFETKEIPNIFQVGLVRDPADGWSFDYIPAVFERIIAYGFGQKTKILPYSPAKIKMTDSPLDRAIRYFTVTIYVITAGLAFLVATLLQAFGVLRQWNAMYGHIIVEGEGWNPKIIECDDIKKPGGGAEVRWLTETAKNYPARLFRETTVKVPLSTREFYNEYLNGFQNAKYLRWNVLSEYAEVTYVEEQQIQLQIAERFV